MAVLAGAGMLVVVVDVVGVAVLAGAGSEVVVVETWHTSITGSAGCDGAVISMSRSSSEARNFAIAFRARSGNGPDRVLAQFCSIRASCVSIFSTVFIFSSVSANMVGFVYVGVVVVAAMAAGLVSGPVRMAERVSLCLQIFLRLSARCRPW
jgi:hypothetical protein